MYELYAGTMPTCASCLDGRHDDCPEMEVGTDQPAFPDVLAELVHEVTRLYRVACRDETEDQP